MLDNTQVDNKAIKWMCITHPLPLSRGESVICGEKVKPTKKRKTMKNQIFKNAEFGQIRTCMVDGETYFVGKDVASALGYVNDSKAIRDHVDEEDKRFGQPDDTHC